MKKFKSKNQIQIQMAKQIEKIFFTKKKKSGRIKPTCDSLTNTKSSVIIPFWSNLTSFG